MQKQIEQNPLAKTEKIDRISSKMIGEAMFIRYGLICMAVVLSGCATTELGVRRLPLKAEYYASTFARTPNPSPDANEAGERLYVDWRIPFKMDPKDFEVVLSVVYKDLSEETIRKPLTGRVGGFNFPLVGDKFKKTKGFLTYKADLIDKNGIVADSWEQAMWVKVLH